MPGVIVLLLGAVFLVAAVAKLRSQAAFAEVLQNFIPTALAKSVALLIPLGELALAAFLFSGSNSKLAVVAAMAVLVVFTIFLTVMWRRGVKGCGCFGEDEDTATTGDGIVRNLILIALAAWVMAGPQAFLIYGPDFSTLLGRVTVAAGMWWLWPCLTALVNRRKYFFNLSKT